MLLRISAITLLLLYVNSNPIVETELGRIEGFYHKLLNGQDTNVFLGIPYAKPPVGELRFERPEPHEPFAHTIRAKKYSAACPSHADMDAVGPENEDCLTLNVMAPKPEFVSKPDEGYPLLFWLHPGGYCIGSARFAATGDSALPGNNGLFDQTLALKWVHDNIKNFDGNPKAITVWGLSAGGASAGQLSVSPYSRPFVSKSIQMSGSFFASWTTSNQVINETRKLMQAVGCERSNSQQAKKCLRRKSLKQLVDAIHHLGYNRKTLNLALYQPRLDGDFFPKDYPELLKESKVPTFIGSANDEGVLLGVFNVLKSINGLGLTPEEISSLTIKEVKKRIRENIFPVNEYGRRAPQIQDRVIDYYLKDLEDPMDPIKVTEIYARIQTHLQFFVPMLYELKERSMLDTPVYVYHNSYYAEHHFPEGTPIKAAVHAAELKTINPSLPDVDWPRITKDSPFRHVHLENKAVVRETYDEDLLRFWLKMREDFGDIVVRNIHFGNYVDEYEKCEL
uniref:COesterase domain-containing protein n=1 Tax=Bursaphelenchus xylophilus TaxID=6326 RepID=A0A1I7RTM0_BURXY